MATDAVSEWWRPAPPATAVARPIATDDHERVAFGALIAFTIILLVSPQAWFPAIKSLRIALVAAGLAAALDLLDPACVVGIVFNNDSSPVFGYAGAYRPYFAKA